MTGLLIAVGLSACGGTTPPEQEQPLAAPTGVAATPGPGYITVSWNDNSTNETGFEVYRDLESGAAVAPQQLGEPLATLPPDSTAYVDMDVDLETPYEYSVLAVKGEESTAAASAPGPASMPLGVDLMVGTSDWNSSQPTGTVLIPYLVFPKAIRDDPAVSITYTITGPPGWNFGSDISRTASTGGSLRSGGYDYIPVDRAPSIAGTYTLSVDVDGVLHTATATLDNADFRLPRSTDVVVLEAEADALTVDWTPPDDSVRDLPMIHGENWVLTMLRNDWEPRSTLHLSEDLEDGVYRFEVRSVNADVVNYPVKIDPFGMSSVSVPFAIGDVSRGACASLEQIVSLPDANLEALIRSELDKLQGDVNCLDMHSLNRLVSLDAGVTDLDGLQYARNLTTLFFNGVNGFTDLEPLGSLTELLRVGFLGSTSLANLSPIEHMTWLEELVISDTNVSNIEFLSAFTSLTTFYASDTAISDLSSLSSLTQLQNLGLEGLGLTDIEFLSGLDQLHVLLLGRNSLTSLSALVANQGLADGDRINVAGNHLDLADPNVMSEIQALLDRGVKVVYEPQTEP